jgi:Cu/Ag efflux pump CusA
MVVALTITPALALILLRNAPLDAHDPPLTGRLKRFYRKILGYIVKAPNATFMATGLITLGGIVAWPLLGHSLMPDFKERDLLMHWVTKPGTSREAMFRNSTGACRELLTIPGINHCGSHIGRAIAGPEIVGMNFGENWIRIAPEVNYERTLAKVQEVAAAYPGIHAPVMTFIRERIKEVISGAGETLVIRLFGPELSVLAAKSKEIEKALASVEGLRGLKAGFQVENPQLQIKVDQSKARQYGLKPGDVRRSVATYVTGTEVTDVFRDGRIFGVVIWSTPETRHSVNDIKDLLLDTPSGRHVRLAEVAEVKIAPTPNAIQRDEFSRRIDITANVAGDRDLGAVMAGVQRQLATVDLPHEYRVQVLGDYAERKNATERLRWVTVVAAIGILLMLQVSFRSWRLAILTFLTLPAAVVGSVLAVYFSGRIVSLGSMVGLLAVLGVAARNGILLVHHYQHLEVEEGVPFGLELVLRGASERLAPILMTSLCTGLALVPLVWSGQLPGHEIEYPMAVVIIGGLISSTLLSLFVVPLLYMMFGRGAAHAESEPARVPVNAA